MSDYTDNFTRADSALTMGTTSGGAGTWQYGGSGSVYGISSNKAYSVVALDNIFAYLETSVTDGDVGVTCSNDGGAGGGCLVFRYVDDNNFLWLRTEIGTNLMRFYDRIAGSYTERASQSVTIGNDAFHVTFNGNNLEAFQNTVSRLTLTTSQFNTATKVGIVARGDTSMRFDDFFFTGSGGGGSVGHRVIGGWGGRTIGD